MSLLANRRYRRILFAAATVVAGGYVSYRVYNSHTFSRKRKQLIHMLASLSIFCESVAQSAECLSLVSKDLMSFLLSDGDSVPRSLRQAFKIAQCPEVQESVTVLSAALTQGLLRGVKGNGCSQGRGASSKLEGRHSRPHGRIHTPENAACKEIREVGVPVARGELTRSTTVLEDDGSIECKEKREVVLSGEVLPSVKEGFERETENNLIGTGSQIVSSERANIMFDRVRQAENATSQDLIERLLGKLFSEPGVGFASAVVGSLARQCVTALLDGSRDKSCDCKVPFARAFVSSFGDNPATDSQHADIRPMDWRAHKIDDVLYNDGCRALIAECIQNFVGTAVSVYIDKTKDVNFYDDMVAGITNPSHLAPMKDVLISVSNGAVETLVRTAHDVLVVKKSEQSGWEARQRWQEQEEFRVKNFTELGESIASKDLQMHNQKPTHSTMASYQQIDANDNSLQRRESYLGSSSGIGKAREMDEEHNHSSKAVEKSIDMQKFIVVLSKMLAIPSNRKLVVDVAGTMTSEAVRSLAGLVTGTVSNYFSTKSEQVCNRVKIDVSEQIGNKDWQLHTKAGKGMTDAAMKAFLLATICLALCLHVLTGFCWLENV